MWSKEASACTTRRTGVPRVAQGQDSPSWARAGTSMFQVEHRERPGSVRGAWTKNGGRGGGSVSSRGWTGLGLHEGPGPGTQGPCRPQALSLSQVI